MEEFLTGLISSDTLPPITALILGLLTAVSPCPLATNITAIGYLSKDIQVKGRIFLNGLVYTLGRVISYTLLAFILFLGADQLKLSGWFQQNGERIIGPLLVLIGLVMLGVIKLNFPGFNKFSSHIEKKVSKSFLDVLLLGIIFAVAFCPYSGVLYFGMLIPMTVQSASGLYLPVIFAIATGLPVIIFAWLLAYTVSGVGNLYRKLKAFELCFRRLIAVLFIGVGVYYIVRIWF
jgi:sulfite exporter TauE/SafE